MQPGRPAKTENAVFEKDRYMSVYKLFKYLADVFAYE
jgi:hypothetical protein